MSSMINIFETKRIKGNWEAYTGRFRCKIESEESLMVFGLPGRGGRVTKQVAREIQSLFDRGIAAGEIARRTGCELHDAL